VGRGLGVGNALIHPVSLPPFSFDIPLFRKGYVVAEIRCHREEGKDPKRRSSPEADQKEVKGDKYSHIWRVFLLKTYADNVGS
jgi:hypothetical protein